MHQIKFDGPLIGARWLKENLGNSDLVILNATLPKAVKAGSIIEEQTKRIPGARFFDIKNVFSDTSAPFPNTWPGEEVFNQAARDLGINQNSAIVVYDEHGIYSSARAWWMFRAMGHQNVAVLNGGLISWEKAGFAIEDKQEVHVNKGDFNGVFNPQYLKNHKDILKTIDNPSELVIDARAESRYLGLVDEPRKGLRSGHIPGSANLPYTDILKDGELLDNKELKELMDTKFSKDQQLNFSCGSGITACILALGAEVAGYQRLSVYDGSWTEWGSLVELPIEKGENG